MTEHRVPQHGNGIRNHELGGLHRVIGVEVVITLHVAGKVNHLRDGLLRWPGIAGLERRQRVARQLTEREPPPGPLGVVHPAVPGHVGAVLRQHDERRHLVQHGVRVRPFLPQLHLRLFRRAQLVLDALTELGVPSPVESPQDLAEARVVIQRHHGVELLTVHPVRRHDNPS